MKSILDTLSFNQLNLDALACPPPPPRFELNEVNNYYGNGETIRRYASLPKSEPLPFVIEHFVPLDYNTPHDFDLHSGLRTFLAVHEKRAEVYSKLGMHSIVGGSGLHYAKKLLEASPSWKMPSKKFGTIAFPHKSEMYKDFSFDFEAFAEWLANLPNEYQPVCVCIYWKDYLEKRHTPYLDRGIPVVSCGHIFDPKFLFRFIDICSHFKYSCGNAVASSYPLSVLCGCHFFYQDFGGVVEQEKNESASHVPNPGSISELGSQLKYLAPFPPNPDTRKDQLALVDFVTGRNHQLSPVELRDIYDVSRTQLLDRQSTNFACLHTTIPSNLTPWLPINIYSDGWSRADARLIIKSTNQTHTFSAYISIPDWFSTEGQPLRVSEIKCPIAEFDCPPGNYKIMIPLLSASEHPIHFHLPSEKRISAEDSRMAAFRFLGWEISDELTTEATCIPTSIEKLPDFIKNTKP